MEEKKFYNKCKAYQIPCPHALILFPDTPCSATKEEDCTDYRKKYQEELTQEKSSIETKVK